MGSTKEITGKQKTKSNLLPQEIKVDRTNIQNPIQQILYFGQTKIGQKSPQHWKKGFKKFWLLIMQKNVVLGIKI